MLRLTPLVCTSSRKKYSPIKKELKSVLPNLHKYTQWNLYNKKIYLNKEDAETNRAIVSSDSINRAVVSRNPVNRAIVSSDSINRAVVSSSSINRAIVSSSSINRAIVFKDSIKKNSLQIRLIQNKTPSTLKPYEYDGQYFVKFVFGTFVFYTFIGILLSGFLYLVGSLLKLVGLL